MPVAEKENGIARHAIYKKVIEKEGKKKHKEASENNQKNG